MSPDSSSAEPTVRLNHGTTKKRAEAILKDGPDPTFIEPGGQFSEPAFYMGRPEGPFSEGSPETCARKKAALFGEGGPAILEVDVPASLIGSSTKWEADKAMDLVAEVVFGPGYGLEKLREAWPSLNKRIFLLSG